MYIDAIHFSVMQSFSTHFKMLSVDIEIDIDKSYYREDGVSQNLNKPVSLELQEQCHFTSPPALCFSLLSPDRESPLHISCPLTQ